MFSVSLKYYTICTAPLNSRKLGQRFKQCIGYNDVRSISGLKLLFQLTTTVTWLTVLLYSNLFLIIREKKHQHMHFSKTDSALDNFISWLYYSPLVSYGVEATRAPFFFYNCVIILKIYCPQVLAPGKVRQKHIRHRSISPWSSSWGD